MWFLMTFQGGGTVTLNRKTYNLSLITAVYTEQIPTSTSGDILLLFGCFIGTIMGLFVLVLGQPLLGLVNILFFGGGGLFFLSTLNTKSGEYSLIFEIGGKKEVVYNGNVVEVENIKNDIILGIQKGYFPNYLQGRQ